MTEAELPRFIEALTGAALVCGRRVTEELVDVYRRALDDIDSASLIRILDRIARTAESGTRFPTPAELRQRVSGSMVKPNTPLDVVAFGRVRQAIWEELAHWEETDGHGSARPHFEAAWHWARQREGGAGTVRQREVLWQAWLQAPSREEERQA